MKINCALYELQWTLPNSIAHSSAQFSMNFFPPVAIGSRVDLSTENKNENGWKDEKRAREKSCELMAIVSFQSG